MLKSKISTALATALLLMVFDAGAVYTASDAYNSKDNLPNEGSGTGADDSADSPWARRMEDASGLFGVKVKGSADGLGVHSDGGFDTFTPWQQNQFEAVGAYGATEVGVGCEGLNLGTVMDGQLSQYSQMVEEFIANAPMMAIMFLAYSQPTVKSVIDELNMVGQFGLDLSNLTCSGVRARADKSLQENMQADAEADCTANAGFKDAKCMAGDGIQDSLLDRMRQVKTDMSSRASTLMGTVSSASGGLIGTKKGGSTGAGGASGTGAPGSSGSGSGSGPTPVTSKNCAGVKTDGTTPYILSSSEMSCDDIKKYSGLVPNFSFEDSAGSVQPKTISIEKLSQQITTEYMGLLSEVYTSNPDTFQNSAAYKKLVNRADIVVSPKEQIFVYNLAKRSPASALAVQRQMSTMAMMKELKIIVAKMEIGLLTGMSNQTDGKYISERIRSQYGSSVESLKKEIELLEIKMQSDTARYKALSASAEALGQ